MEPAIAMMTDSTTRDVVSGMHHADQLPVAQREKRTTSSKNFDSYSDDTSRHRAPDYRSSTRSLEICADLYLRASTAFERSASLRTLRIAPPTRWDNTVAGRRADASGIAKFEVKRSSGPCRPGHIAYLLERRRASKLQQDVNGEHHPDAFRFP